MRLRQGSPVSSLTPSDPFLLAAKQTASEKNECLEQTDFQHERHLPGKILNIGKW
jgi:hypothetical protein